MPDDGEGNAAGKTDASPRKPTKPADSDSPAPAGEAQPCCCEKITLYLDRVKVNARTDAPIPILGVLLGETVEDRISVVCTSCDGATFTWPSNAPGLKVKKGWDGETPNAPLATILPDKSCQVSCHVKVRVLRASLATDILDAINKLLPDIAAAAAAIAAAKLAGASASVVAALQDKADRLSQDLTDLLKKLSQADQALMDEFFFNFEGSLHCDGNVEDAIENTSGVVAVGKGQNLIRFDRTIQNYGGEWELQFSASRYCKHTHK
jgi:hypothetical protein